MSESDSHSPLVDLTEVLEVIGDDAELLAEMVEEFVKSTSNLIDALQIDLEQMNAPKAMQDAHTIKGAAAAFGAESLREVAFRIEQLALQGKLAEAAVLLAELKQEWQAVECEVQLLLADRKS
jgi:HPt (histidine-containing phosphotransfer) domain-containing protein